MHVILAAVLAAVLVTGSVTNARPADLVKPVILEDSGGGITHNFEWFYEALKKSGIPVRVRGICLSACTWVFLLPKEQVCVEPTAVFGFHLVADGPNRVQPKLAASYFKRVYPDTLYRWVMAQDLRNFVYLSAEEVVKMNLLPACD